VSVLVDEINAAVGAISLAILPQSAAQLTVAAAEAVDRHLENMNPELIATIEANGGVRILNRALHRREHLDQIEQALGNRIRCSEGCGAGPATGSRVAFFVNGAVEDVRDCSTRSAVLSMIGKIAVGPESSIS